MRKRSISLALLGLTFSGAAIAAEVQDHLLSGAKFAQEKKYKEAQREYENAVAIDPTNADANLLLGLTLANTGDLDRGIPYIKTAMKSKPNYSGYYSLGLMYATQSRYAEAAEALENSVKINPDSYQAWHQLGKVYFTDLKFDKAIEAYSKVVAVNPKFAEAYQGLGSSYYWNGERDKALEQVEKLNAVGLGSRAQELNEWIKDKDLKKQKAAPKTEPAASEPAQADPASK